MRLKVFKDVLLVEAKTCIAGQKNLFVCKKNFGSICTSWADMKFFADYEFVERLVRDLDECYALSLYDLLKEVFCWIFLRILLKIVSCLCCFAIFCVGLWNDCK